MERFSSESTKLPMFGDPPLSVNELLHVTWSPLTGRNGFQNYTFDDSDFTDGSSVVSRIDPPAVTIPDLILFSFFFFCLRSSFFFFVFLFRRFTFISWLYGTESWFGHFWGIFSGNEVTKFQRMIEWIFIHERKLCQARIVVGVN